MSLPMYRLRHISFACGERPIIDDLSITLDGGRFYGIIGPNGSGKTTLVDLLSGHLRPDKGEITLDGRPLQHYARKELAHRIAVVPQDFSINFPYTCREVVMMGRYPHLPRFTPPGENDRAVVEDVLDRTALTDFSDRHVDRLSGGERQRVVFARGLAQQTDVLLLDEATASLDMQHAIDLLNLAARQVTDGATVIAVMQDINLAAIYCDQLVCIRQGRLAAAGPTNQVLNAELLKRVFRINAQVDYHPHANALQVAFNRGAR